jgi:hypothetical protein
MITDFDTLKTEVAASLARSDVTADSAEVETYIRMAEKYINRNLRVKQMEKDVSISTTAGEAKSDLPSDFLEVKRLKFDSDPTHIGYLASGSFGNDQSDRPQYFTLANNSTNEVQALEFFPTPNAEYDLTLRYYAAIPALTSSNTDNWLLAYDEDIYLTGALYYLFRRFRNTLAGEYKAEFQGKIADMNKEEMVKAFGPSPSRTRVRAKIV